MSLAASIRALGCGNGALDISRQSSSSRLRRHTRSVPRPCVVAAAAPAHDPAFTQPNHQQQPQPQPQAQGMKYAILQLGGVRQMLQEGLLYTCPKRIMYDSAGSSHSNGASASITASSSGNQRSFLLRNVLGVREGERFTWGRPYLRDIVVEVEVVDEVAGPCRPAHALATAAAGAGPSSNEDATTALSSGTAAAALTSAQDDSLMAIYRVKHILSSGTATP